MVSPTRRSTIVALLCLRAGVVTREATMTRLPTLEDTVEFFNPIFDLKLTCEEKQDLVALLRVL